MLGNLWSTALIAFSTAISIGDEEKDIIASNNAGAKSVLVKWGNSGNNNYAANYHCESVDELKRILFES